MIKETFYPKNKYYFTKLNLKRFIELNLDEDIKNETVDRLYNLSLNEYEYEFHFEGYDYATRIDLQQTYETWKMTFMDFIDWWTEILHERAHDFSKDCWSEAYEDGLLVMDLYEMKCKIYEKKVKKLEKKEQ